MADSLVFGAFVPQGWKMELAEIEGSSAQWDQTVSIARTVELLGYDSIWVYDHVHNVPRPAQEAVFECWTTLAALSQITTRVRLGQMVGCNSYRNPALLAKITATLDVVSGGRLDWGIGAGWYENEYRSYGYDFPAAKERLEMLAETVQIVTSMWNNGETTFDGKHYQVSNAQCDPKPLQAPRPPVWIGGGGEKVTLKIVARYADCSNFGGTPTEWAHKRDVLREHCATVARDPDEIRMTWSPEVFIRATEDEIDEAGSRSLWGGDPEAWRAGNLVGTPEQVTEKLKAYVGLGLGGVVPWCADYPETETLTRFAEEVMPEFR